MTGFAIAREKEKIEAFEVLEGCEFFMRELGCGFGEGTSAVFH